MNLKDFLLITLAAIAVGGLIPPAKAAEDGGRPDTFLSYAASARSLGMGKAHIGVADDASAIYWNPAGLQQIKRPDVVSL